MWWTKLKAIINAIRIILNAGHEVGLYDEKTGVKLGGPKL